MNVDKRAMETELERELGKIPSVTGSGGDGLYATRRFSELLIKAEDSIKRFGDSYAGVEHLYLALLAERDTASARLLAKYGIDTEKFLAALTDVRKNQRVTSQNPEIYVRSAAQIRHRSGGGSEERQTRSGDRARPGDPPRDHDSLPEDKKQPCAHRRARRRQDGRC
jgi:ATP-dependent Clp protease ATP-binding subunit ClpA